ncbi:MAG: DUF2520 domain-containing protein [Halanaerobiales bacterium]|nr:DUF2520 domain-containing protein [Halanaerobiales bacterium]
MGKKFALIGPGRVGTALSYLLQSHGFTLKMVVGRSNASLERVKSYLYDHSSIPIFTRDLVLLPSDLDFIILAVQDDHIHDVIKSMWEKNLIKSKHVLIHLSGVHPSDVGNLSQMAEISRLALHPLQAVADVDAGISKLPNTVWSLEGDKRGLELGEEIMKALSTRYLKITKEQKAIYHASACVVSNYLVTLVHTGIEMLKSVGVTEELAQKALLPLVQGTVENLSHKTPKSALTGPIARSDIATIEKHIHAISQVNSDWLELYSMLGRATLEFAPQTEQACQTLSRIFTKEEN